MKAFFFWLGDAVAAPLGQIFLWWVFKVDEPGPRLLLVRLSCCS